MKHALLIGLIALSLIAAWLTLGALAINIVNLALTANAEPAGDPIDDPDPLPDPYYISRNDVSLLGDPIDDPDPLPDPYARSP